MDAKDACIALKAWRSLPAAVRRDVVDLAKDGRPSPDPQVARLAIDWGRGEAPLAYIREFAGVLLLMLIPAIHNLPVGVGVRICFLVLVGLPLLLLVSWKSHHEGAEPVGRQNLAARVAAGDYPERSGLTVRAVGRPWWFVGAVALSLAACLASFVLHLGGPPAGPRSGGVWSSAAIVLVVLAAILTPVLSRLTRRAAPFAGPGTPLLGLGPQGLRISIPDRPFVAWTDVASAQPTITDAAAMGDLAITFVLERPHRVVDVPVHWFAEDPGVVLATANMYIANAPRRPIVPVAPVIPPIPRSPIPVPTLPSAATGIPASVDEAPRPSVRRAYPADLD